MLFDPFEEIASTLSTTWNTMAAFMTPPGLLGPNWELSMVAQPVLVHRLNQCRRSEPADRRSTQGTERDVRYPDVLIAMRDGAASPQ